ncbi:MAG: hypothetical protein C5B49_12260 [Bdellovibrio sp.]|nr:MAG: hypothetical protein C5B49_12260 [Bdellovibrio sp.]
MVQVNYNAYVEDPKSAYADLEKMCSELGLDAKEYRGLLTDSIDNARSVLSSDLYKPFSQAIVEHPKVEGWGQAVDARPKSQAISSQDRVWPATNKDPIAVQIHAKNRELKAVADRLRETYRSDEVDGGILKRRLGNEHRVENLTLAKLTDNDPFDVLRAAFNETNSATAAKDARLAAVLEEIENSPKFSNPIALAIGGVGGEFGAWASEHMGPIHPPAMVAAIFSEDSKIRTRGHALFDKLPPEARMEIASEVPLGKSQTAIAELLDMMAPLASQHPDLREPFGTLVKKAVEGEPGPSLLSSASKHFSLLEERDLNSLAVYGIDPVKIEAFKNAKTRGIYLSAAADALDPTKEPGVREAARTSLGKLMDDLKSPSSETREAAYKTMKMKFSDQGINHFLNESEVLLSNSPEVIDHAIQQAHFTTHQSEILAHAIRRVEAASPGIQAKIAQAYCQTDSLSDELYAKIAKSPHPEVRAKVFARVGVYSSPNQSSADKFVLKGLKDPNPLVRKAAEVFLKDWIKNMAADNGHYSGASLRRLNDLPVQDHIEILKKSNLIRPNNPRILGPIVHLQEWVTDLSFERLATPQVRDSVYQLLRGVGKIYDKLPPVRRSDFATTLTSALFHLDRSALEDLHSPDPARIDIGKKHLTELASELKDGKYSGVIAYERLRLLGPVERINLIDSEGLLHDSNPHWLQAAKTAFHTHGEDLRRFPAIGEKVRGMTNEALQRIGAHLDATQSGELIRDIASFYRPRDRESISRNGGESEIDARIQAWQEDFRHSGPRRMLALQRFEQIPFRHQLQFAVKKGFLSHDNPLLVEIMEQISKGIDESVSGDVDAMSLMHQKVKEIMSDPRAQIGKSADELARLKTAFDEFGRNLRIILAKDTRADFVDRWKIVEEDGLLKPDSPVVSSLISQFNQEFKKSLPDMDPASRLKFNHTLNDLRVHLRQSTTLESWQVKGMESDIRTIFKIMDLDSLAPRNDIQTAEAHFNELKHDLLNRTPTSELAYERLGSVSPEYTIDFIDKMNLFNFENKNLSQAMKSASALLQSSGSQRRAVSHRVAEFLSKDNNLQKIRQGDDLELRNVTADFLNQAKQQPELKGIINKKLGRFPSLPAHDVQRSRFARGVRDFSAQLGRRLVGVFLRKRPVSEVECMEGAVRILRASESDTELPP